MHRRRGNAVQNLTFLQLGFSKNSLGRNVLFSSCLKVKKKNLRTVEKG